MKTRLLPLLLISLACLSRADAPPASDDKGRASAALEQAVKADPNNAELWLHLGFAYRKQDRLDDAARAFEKASTLDPKNQESLYMLGLIYEKQGKNADALRVWKQYASVATDPEKKSTADNHIHRL